MLVGMFLGALTSFCLVAPLTFFSGHRLRSSGPLPTLAAVALLGAAVSVLGRSLWHASPGPSAAEGAAVAIAGLIVWRARPHWNVLGRLFLSTLAWTAVTALGVAALGVVEARAPAPALGVLGLLWLLEGAAFGITVWFGFETCDVVCRVRSDRPQPAFDASYQPMVSLHVPTYAEPPDLVIETIRSLEALDYPELEVVVVDNNTADEELWGPVAEYCAGSDRVKFVHVEPWPGYKAGALNLALESYTDERAEVVGVVDADYRVHPEYLRRTVGYFCDGGVGFVQTPQAYRGWEGNRYFTACRDAYRYFFEASMPSRDQRNSIIFGGTMGLVRRSVLEQIGGWSERCITEDAEASLRILKAGYTGVYRNEELGWGFLPLSFGALKRQMFRWCFGGVQILREHGRSLLPWDRDPENHLTVAQRADYLFGGLQWFGNLLAVAFAAVISTIGLLLLAQQGVLSSGVVSLAAFAPVSILVAGVTRTLWALRRRCGISLVRAALAFSVWLALSWVLARACIAGLLHAEGVFLRTPKVATRGRLWESLSEARVEAAISLGMCSLAAAVALDGLGVFAALFLLWQGVLFGTAPAMVYLAHRGQVTSDQLARALLERSRIWPRGGRLTAPRLGLAALVIVGACVAMVGTLGAGETHGRSFSPLLPFAASAPGRSPRQVARLAKGGGVVPGGAPRSPGAGTQTISRSLGSPEPLQSPGQTSGLATSAPSPGRAPGSGRTTTTTTTTTTMTTTTTTTTAPPSSTPPSTTPPSTTPPSTTPPSTTPPSTTPPSTTPPSTTPPSTTPPSTTPPSTTPRA